MILDEVTMPEYERGLAASRTVLIPFGSLEEHSAHLPLSTDTLQVVEVCRRAAERTGAHVAPAVAYGVCRSTRDHPGTTASRSWQVTRSPGRSFSRMPFPGILLARCSSES